VKVIEVIGVTQSEYSKVICGITRREKRGLFVRSLAVSGVKGDLLEMSRS